MSRDFNLPPPGSNIPNRTDVPTQTDPKAWASAFGTVPQIASHTTGPVASIICSTISDDREPLRKRLMEDLMQAIQRPKKRSCWNSAFEGFEKACQKFLDNGFDLNIKGEDGRLPLVRAIRYGTLAMVEHLILNGARLDEEDGWRRNGYTAGLIVDADGDAIFDFIVAQLPSHEVASMSREALYEASREGYYHAVFRLLERGIRFEYRDALGMNAAHIAAAYGRTDVLSLLKRTDRTYFKMRDTQGRTPLHHAIPHRNDHDILTERKIATLKVIMEDYGCLLDPPLQTDGQDHDGRTALHLAVIGGSKEAVQRLLSPSTVLIPDKFGKLPLHYALETGALDIVGVLLSPSSFDPKTQTHFGSDNRPVDIAQRNQQHDVLRLFAEYQERYERCPRKSEVVWIGRPTEGGPGAAEPKE